jgi:hypothetical protein
MLSQLSYSPSSISKRSTKPPASGAAESFALFYLEAIDEAARFWSG